MTLTIARAFITRSKTLTGNCGWCVNVRQLAPFTFHSRTGRALGLSHTDAVDPLRVLRILLSPKSFGLVNPHANTWESKVKTKRLGI